MTDKKTVPVNLNRGSARLLTQLLSAPEWYAGEQATAHITRTGAMLEDPAFEFEVPDERAMSADAFRVWADTAVAFAPSVKQYDTAKVCVAHFAKKGALPNSKYTARLVREFGLASED